MTSLKAPLLKQNPGFLSRASALYYMGFCRCLLNHAWQEINAITTEPSLQHRNTLFKRPVSFFPASKSSFLGNYVYNGTF